jgi:platelet-activating factor acetylhydrolase
MPILENPAGPYAVGAATFVLPVRPALVVGGAAIRTETGQKVPALRLEEVSFTAYYPVSPTIPKSRWPWLNWFPRYILRFSSLPIFHLSSFPHPMVVDPWR